METDVFVGTLGPDGEGHQERFIYGLNGDDNLRGESDLPSQIYGGQGNDDLKYLGPSTSKIYGEDGNDVLTGAEHNDVLSGGDGSDLFIFLTSFAPDNVDRIVDFEPGIDKIVIFGDIAPELGDGVSKGEFRIGTKAHDKSDHLLYDQKHGKLYYDADGKGEDGKVLFALLPKHLDLDHNDFGVAVLHL
jgi:Ca2+-binding RTX toxin-like protein